MTLLEIGNILVTTEVIVEKTEVIEIASVAGTPGPKGDKGDKGDTGAASTVPGPPSTIPGPKGDKGDKGDTGADSTVPGPPSTIPGPKGDKGDKGDTGADSTVPGPTGSKGDKGDTGASPVLSTTSLSSVLIGAVGQVKTFTLDTPTDFKIGMVISAVRTASQLNFYIVGIITAISPTSVTITTITSKGTGTFTDWIIDLAGREGQIGPAFTPTWVDYIPTTTNVTGTPATIARYMLVGKLCKVRVRVTLNGANFGTTPTWTLPVAASDALVHVVGLSQMRTTSGSKDHQGFVRLNGDNTCRPTVVDTASATLSGAGFVSATQPFTWAVNDYLEMNFEYEAA